MHKPWVLAGSSLPFQALPLAGGTWRGPAPEDAQAEQVLARSGWTFLGTLPDGAGLYRPPLTVQESSVPVDMRPQSAAWILARLEAGFAAMAEPLPEPKFLAILNLSPDSFSDGGQAPAASLGEGKHALLYRAQCLIAEGADCFDLGAESTRPGAQAVPAEEQLARLLPAIDALSILDLPLSVDTRNAEVAKRCLAEGVSMINDVSALDDPDMTEVLASTQVPVVLMHMRGTPETMQEHCQYQHLLGEIADELMEKVGKAQAAGIDPSRLILDPGIGFAKNPVQSQSLLVEGGSLRALGFPLLFGPSRKSFMAEALLGKQPHQRDGGTSGAAALCAQQGASWIRLHRGGRIWDAVRVASACAAQATAPYAVQAESPASPMPAEVRS